MSDSVPMKLAGKPKPPPAPDPTPAERRQVKLSLALQQLCSTLEELAREQEAEDECRVQMVRERTRIQELSVELDEINQEGVHHMY